MRVLAWVLGLALVAGMVILSVAGVPAASAVLLTGGAVVAMIAMGGVMGGRKTPNRPPVPGPDQPPPGASPEGTMEG